LGVENLIDNRGSQQWDREFSEPFLEECGSVVNGRGWGHDGFWKPEENTKVLDEDMLAALTEKADALGKVADIAADARKERGNAILI
jgi:hypothetical protein